MSREETSSAVSPAVEAFIARWSPPGGGERSNYQFFLAELCNVQNILAMFDTAYECGFYG